jgi:hypothetical protein
LPLEQMFKSLPGLLGSKIRNDTIQTKGNTYHDDRHHL